MTRALVVYESVFGDARSIAQAVAEGLFGTVPADVVAAAEAPADIGPDVVLLVVGGPNHAFGMPSPSTRQGAVDQHGADIRDIRTGLHEWLETVHVSAPHLPAAAFDTRSGEHRLIARMDHAARTEETLLRRTGAHLVAPAEHFSVAGTKGPLVEGEQDRAREWGRLLAGHVSGAAAAG
ncbi:flavodoxin family protein [Geodermatophilus nigrescens]